MATTKQAEYNRLRAELDKLKRENLGASQEMFGSRHDAYVAKVKAIEKKIRAISPKTEVLFLEKAILDAEAKVQSSKAGTPGRVAALAELKKLNDTSLAQNASEGSEKAFDEGYKKSVKDAKDAKKALKDRSDTDKKKRDEIAQWKSDNDIRKAKQLPELPMPAHLKDKADTVVTPGAPKTDLATLEPMLGWAAYVPTDGFQKRGPIAQSPDEARLNPRSSSTPERNRMLTTEAYQLFAGDPKIRKQVMAIMSNAGVEVDGQMAAEEWYAAVSKSNDMAVKMGYIVTPMDILNSKYGTSKGPTSSSNKSIVEYTSQYMGAIVDKMFQETLGKDPTPAQRSRYVTEFQKLAAQGKVTTTTTTGKNSVSKTKVGFRPEDEALKLGEQLEKSPVHAVDYKQKQALDFNDAFNRIMAGGL